MIGAIIGDIIGSPYEERKMEFIDYRTILDYMGGDNRKGRQAYRRFVIREISSEKESPLVAGKEHGIVGDEKSIDLNYPGCVSKGEIYKEGGGIERTNGNKKIKKSM